MRSLSEWVRDWEAMPTNVDSNNLVAKYLDTAWIDQRLEHLDYEQPFNFTETYDRYRQFLIIGEADYVAPMLQQAPGRIPRVMDIWHLELAAGTLRTRTLSGRFVEYRPLGAFETDENRPGSSSNPATRVYPATLFPAPVGRRRPASPSSSVPASRRRRYEVGSPAVESGHEGEGSAGSEDEEMRS
jgi:hypothetical protein